MAARLARAFADNLVVFDPNPETIWAAVPELGVMAGTPIADVSERADILFPCVPKNDTVRNIYLGQDGVVSAIREVHGSLRAVGAHHLDASMPGAVAQANEGTISFVVGGDADLPASMKALEARLGIAIAKSKMPRGLARWLFWYLKKGEAREGGIRIDWTLRPVFGVFGP